MKSSGRRGVALIAVIMLLAGLTAIGAPFLISTALDERESRLFSARTRARAAAEGALARALWCLSRTGEGIERDGYYGFPFDTPEFDTMDELRVDFRFHEPPVPKGQKPVPLPEALSPEESSPALRNPRGEIWKAEIEDEQGKINVNSASPALIGNLLGSTVLTAQIAANDASMPVGSTAAMPADNDDQTIDGFVRVGREIIAYRSKSGSSLDNLVRGCFGTSAEGHPANALVYDARGWAVAAYKIAKAGGNGGALARFQSVPSIARIAELNLTAGGKTLEIDPVTLEAVERCFTVGSYRAKADGWVRREAVMNATITADQQTFLLRDNANFGPGTVVRFIDSSGQVRGYGRIYTARHQQPPTPAGAPVTLEYACGFGFNADPRNELFIEAELPHAVNVNTARLPVLAACMTGLALTGGGPVVTPDHAWLVANRLVTKVFRDDKGRDIQAIRNKDDLDVVLREAVQANEINDLERQAILENATVAGSTRLRMSTAPFCFRAYSLFTIEASAIVSSPTSGRPLSEYTIRELVQMPTDRSTVFDVRSQKEFEEQIKSGVGKKVDTWPVWMGNAANNNIADSNRDFGIGDVRLGTGRVGPTLAHTVRVDHFENNLPAGWLLTPDGVQTTGRALQYAGVFNGSPVMPGSAEAWFAARAWTGSLFHAEDSRTSNYLDVTYDAGNREMVMELADGTMNDGDFPMKTVQYRQSYNLDINTWYHIRAAYTSTHLGGQAFQVDAGMVAPSDAKGRYSPMATLGAALDNWPAPHKLTDPCPVTVDDTSAFPAAGAFIIDGEIFEYTTKDQTTFLDAKRGRRFTQPVAHQVGAAVQIYGYSVGISRVPAVNGLVAEDISANPRTTINKPAQVGPPAVPGEIDDKVTTLPVASTDGFQSSGYLWCEQECIYYAEKTATEFRKCIRGLFAGPAAIHQHGRQLTQISLLVTNHNNYPNSGTVQIDESGQANRVEWIDYAQKRNDAGGKCYLMPVFSQDSNRNWYYSSFRGTYGSGARAHAKGAKIIPVFDISGPQCGDTSSPQYEPVTVVNPGGEREPHKLKRVFESTGYWWDQDRRVGGWTHTFRAAFDDFVTRDYSGARLLKFPSGELAVRLPALELGRGFTGKIDELRVASGHTVAGTLPFDGSDPTYGRLDMAGTNVVVHLPSQAAANQIPTVGGIVQIDDEILYFQGRSISQRTMPYTPRIPFRTPPPQYDGSPGDSSATHHITIATLNNVRRAVLGSTAAAHAPGAPVVFLEAFPVTELTGGLPAAASDISVANASGFDDEGYLLVNSEIIGYSARRGNTLTGGMFRGAYGTMAQNHNAGDIARALPFRYWDRFIPENDRSELAYFQGGFTAVGSRWSTLKLDVVNAPGAIVYTLVRFNGAPAWNSRPTNRDGGLYAFTGPGPHELKTQSGQAVRADQIEYRIFFPFNRGVTRGSQWKTTPAVDSVTISYSHPLVVLRREVSQR